SYSNLVVDFDSGGSVLVKNQFQGSTNGVDQIEFDDGTVLNRAAIKADAVIYGTSGNDSYYGSSDSENFDMLGGNDYVSGGGGNDTFIEEAQSGNDTFDESGLAGDTNTLRLVGVSLADVQLDRSG